ncbi:MAG: hypothetical protein IJ244_02560 [Bacteroidaceae bacterium]|nr:hypothetical protein [Bacteroidaceae bacterium]
MNKALQVLLLLIVSLFPKAVAQLNSSQSSTGTSITVVSDTTDAEDDALSIDTTFYVPQGTSNLKIVTPGKPTLPDWFPLNVESWFGLLGWGSLAIFIVFMLIGLAVIFSPIGLIILVIYLINKQDRKKHTTNIAKTDTIPTYALPPTTEQRKDKAILHMALGVGVCILFYIIHLKVGIGAGIVILLYGVGEMINALRHRNDNRQ